MEQQAQLTYTHIVRKVNGRSDEKGVSHQSNSQSVEGETGSLGENGNLAAYSSSMFGSRSVHPFEERLDSKREREDAFLSDASILSLLFF